MADLHTEIRLELVDVQYKINIMKRSNIHVKMDSIIDQRLLNPNRYQDE